MKLSTLSSLFVLMSVVSLIAIAPSAFAAHHEVTIENAARISNNPGCVTLTHASFQIQLQ